MITRHAEREAYASTSLRRGLFRKHVTLFVVVICGTLAEGSRKCHNMAPMRRAK